MRATITVIAELGVWGLGSLCWAAPPQPEAPFDAGSQSREHRIPAPPPANDVFRLRDEAVPPPGVRMFVEHPGDEQQEAGKPWIGVQLAPVPAALASQLGIEHKGLMVRNVFVDSPADKVGLQQYDVLLKADDKDVAGTVETFSKTVRQRKAGETVHLTLMRGGRQIVQDIQLAEAPRPDELKPKFPEEPDVLYRRDFGLRGRILWPGPNGWEMEDLGNLPEMEPFFEDFVPDRFHLRSGPQGRGGREAAPDHARRVGKNGEKIDVRRQKDGMIEVRREKQATTRPSGGVSKMEVQVTVYPNLDELRKGDPEAADLLSEPPSPPSAPRARPARPAAPPPDQERDQGPNEDGKPQRRRVPAPQDERWREWRQRFFQDPFERGQNDRRGGSQRPDQPNVRFDVQPDGKITVHKRDGDAEISVTYANRDEFHQKAPELCKQFEEMQQSLK